MPGFSIATGYVDVLPQTDGFAARLARELGRLAPVDIPAQINTDRLREQLRRELSEGGRRAGEDAGDQLNRGAERTSGASRWRSFGSGIARQVSAGIAAIGIGRAFVGSITAASDLSETVSKARVVFGDAASSVLALGDTAARSLGQSREQAIGAAATMGNLFVSMGLTRTRAADMSTSMVRLASDFASFNNASPTDTLEAIRSALVGEYDPIQNLGVNLNAATVQAYALAHGMAANASAITPAIQAQAAYGLILEQSKTAQGDFARTSGGAANQSRILKAELTDLSARAGSTFLPVVNRMLGGLTSMVTAIPSAAASLRDRFGPSLDRAMGSLRSTAGTVAAGLMPSLRNLDGFVRGSVWPIIVSLAGVFSGTLWPAVRDVGTLIGGVLLVAFRALSALLNNPVGPALRAVAGFLAQHQTAIAALAVAVVAGVAAWKLYQGAVVAVTTVQWIWQTRTLLMEAATRLVSGGLAAMRAAVMGVNAAIAANPIGAAIVILVALAAAFAYAYTHSEAFRRIVQAALGGVADAARATGGFFVSFGLGVMGVLRATGGGFFSFGSGVMVVLRDIGSGVTFAVGLWTGTFRGGVAAIGSVVSGGFAIVRGVIDIALGGILTAARLWWTAFTLPFRVGFEVIRGLFSFFSALFRGDWDGAWNAISGTTNRVLGLVRGAINTGLGAIKGMFSTTVSGVRVIWDGLREVAAAPVRFVVNTVYNNGIRRAWNAIVAKIPGVPEMGALNVPGLAAGGPIIGGVPGRDSVLRWLMPGEHVWTDEEVRAAGGHRAMFALRRLFGGGGQATGPGMILGGVGDALGSAWDATGGKVVGKLGDLAREGLARGFELALAPIRSGINATLGTGNDWRGAIGKLIQSPFTKLLDWVRGKETEVPASAGAGPGGGVERWRAVALQALALAGQPASWIGLLLRRMNQESGGNPQATNNWDINAKHGDPSRGLMQTIGATFNAYAGPYRSRGIYDPLANIYAAIRYTLARYGSLSAWGRPGGYARGGLPPAGVPFWVGEEGPELMMLGRGTRASVTPTQGTAGPRIVNHFHLDRGMSTPEVVAEMQRRLALAVA